VYDYSGTIAAGGTAQAAAPAYVGRQYVLVQNNGTADLWWDFDVTPPASQPSRLLRSNQSFLAESSFVPAGAINVYGATTGQPYTVKCGPQ
jgi:hypothetical protein